MAYSLDYRQRVMKIKSEENLTFEETSKRFGVAMRTLFNWKQRLEPKNTRDKPAIKIDMEALAKDVEEHPDAYQYERADKFGVSQWGIGLALRRLKVSYKKNSESSKSERSGTYSLPKKNSRL